MIGLSADTPADGQKLVSEMKLTFPVLSDVYRNYIRQYGVLHPEEGIARPSIFLLNKEGKVVWKYVGADYMDRPPMPLVLQHVQSIK